MSRKLRLLLFAGGAVLFTALVARAGARTLLGDVGRTGWMFIPILAVYGLVYVCSAAAWGVVMAAEPNRPPLGRTFAITVSGFSLNFLTPLINLGGEPFKIAAVSPWLGAQRAAGSVVLHRMLHTLGLLLSFLTAVLLGFVLLPRDPAVLGALAVAGAALVVLTLLLLTGHRRGGLEAALNLLHRVPVLSRLARGLEPRRPALAELDRQIAEFYHRSPARFFRAATLEYVGRCLFMVEYLLIVSSVGSPIGYPEAFLIGGLTQLVQNVLFVVPFEVGTKEGTLYLLFQLLGRDPALGVYAAVVSRARDLVWIGAGLGLVWLGSRRFASPTEREG